MQKPFYCHCFAILTCKSSLYLISAGAIEIFGFIVLPFLLSSAFTLSLKNAFSEKWCVVVCVLVVDYKSLLYHFIKVPFILYFGHDMTRVTWTSLKEMESSSLGLALTHILFLLNWMICNHILFIHNQQNVFIEPIFFLFFYLFALTI